MIKIENIQVFNLEGAIKSMRMPFMSFDKSDSGIGCKYDICNECGFVSCEKRNREYHIGEKDLELARKLYQGGSPHSKFMRAITVNMEITAPAYWLAEADTYKIGSVRNSSSLMHIGGKRDFTVDDFSFESIDQEDAQHLVDIANKYRCKYANDKTNDNIEALRQVIGMAYNYTSTFTLNYATIANMIVWRKDHRLKEWRDFCDIMLKELPYLKEIMDIQNEG